MAGGIVLVQHYLSEALRIRAISAALPDLELAERLLRWLHEDWSEPERLVSLPDIYQAGPYSIRDKETAKKIVVILQDHGWLERVPDGAVVNGMRRREVWHVISKEAQTARAPSNGLTPTQDS
jgi:hypothetical protein